MRSRRSGACRRDANHDAILKFARTIPGLVVEDTHEVGSRCLPGFPDALLIWRGRIYPIEIKAGAGMLTAGEEQLAARWAGAGVRVEVVRREADVLRVLGLVAPSFQVGA